MMAPSDLTAASPLSWLLSVKPSSLLLLMALVTRISGVMLTAPPFNNPHIPPMSKMGIALGFALIWWLYAFQGNHALTATLLQGVLHPWHYALVLLQELGIGLILGWAVGWFIQAVGMGASLLGIQMGLQLSNQMDPLGQSDQTGSLNPFFTLTAMTWFLTHSLHHAVFLALDKTLGQVPVAQAFWWESTRTLQHFMERLLAVFSHVIGIGLLVALPLMGMLFLVEVGLGYVGKMQPRLNLFSLATPLKVIVGLATLTLILPMMIWLLEREVMPSFPKMIFTLMAQPS
ncbi:MAG: flagellar biosynthetic protein FliR [Vampirovibrionales bacterium]